MVSALLVFLPANHIPWCAADPHADPVAKRNFSGRVHPEPVALDVVAGRACAIQVHPYMIARDQVSSVDRTTDEIVVALFNQDTNPVAVRG